MKAFLSGCTSTSGRFIFALHFLSGAFCGQGFWRGVRCTWPSVNEEGLWPSTPQFAPHNQGFRNPPHNSMASAAVITKRSNRALSRLKSTTERKNSASNGIRATRVYQLKSPAEA